MPANLPPTRSLPKRIAWLVGIAALIVAVMAACTSQPDPLLPDPTVETSSSHLTFTPTHDATIRESRPTRNYGSDPLLEVDASSRKDMLLQFNVAGTGGAAIQSATLRIHNLNSSNDGGAFHGVTDNGWDENTVTWTNAPAANGGQLGLLGRVEPGTWYAVDVTSFVAGDGPVSFRVDSSSANGADYASKENASGNAPELVVVLGGPPVPDAGPPSAPGNLQVTDEQWSHVGLAWDASTDDVGVTRYDIHRDGALLDSVGGAVTTYQDTTVNPSSSYTYTVVARDAAANTSPASNPATANTPAQPPTSGLTFDITRSGGTYRAVARNGPQSYSSSSVKSVFQDALDDLRNDGGGTIVFGAGEFDLGSDYFEVKDVDNVVIEGQGMGVTIIRNHNSSGNDTEPINGARADFITVRDLTVFAGGSDRSTSDALDFDGGDYVLVERVEVADSRGRGIIFDGKDDPSVNGGTADHNIVRDCVVHNVPQDGIQLLASRHTRIENCHIYDVGRDGIRVHKGSSSAGQANKTSDDNTLVDNLIENAAYNGIRITSGDRNTVVNNTLRNNARDGVNIHAGSGALKCDDNVVDGNTISNNGDFGLNIENSVCERTVVGANSFSGNSSGDIEDRGTDTIYTGGDTQQPSAPGNLRTTDVQSSYVDLAWDASSDNVGVTGYDIHRDGSLLTSVGAVTSYRDSSVAASTAYEYRAYARDAAGNRSGSSNPVNVTTLAGGGPPPPPPPGGGLTFTPTDDATVRESRPDRNYGSDPQLEVDASSRKDTLVRFDVSGVGAATIQSATLRLYNVGSSPVGGTVHGVTNDNWSEASVTWSTAPAGDGGVLGAFGDVNPGTWYEVNVTPFVTGDGPVSFRIDSTSANGADYASKENANGNAPQLVVTTQ